MSTIRKCRLCGVIAGTGLGDICPGHGGLVGSHSWIDVRKRFGVEHPPIPRDAISDELTTEDPPRYVAVVPIGHADAWIAGAEYESERISDALWRLAMTRPVDEDGELLRTVDVLELLGPDAVEAWRRGAARNAGIGDA